MRRNLTLTALTCAALAACGTPQERCIAGNTREYRTVSNLLEEVQRNLARGYAWDERQVETTVWDDCPVFYRTKDGDRRVYARPCLRDVVHTERFRVAIDPLSEERKRDNLQARLRELTPGAEAAVRACRAAHPE